MKMRKRSGILMVMAGMILSQAQAQAQAQAQVEVGIKAEAAVTPSMAETATAQVIPPIAVTAAAQITPPVDETAAAPVAGPAAAQLTPVHCAKNQSQMNDNNNLLLLGGTAKGPMRQFIVGEFGKDTDQQKRMLGKFDRCGVLTDATINYDKRDGNTRLQLDMTVLRTDDGWEAHYEMTIAAQREPQGEEVVVHHKEGTTHYIRGRSGNIISATDSYVLQGQEGFTQTLNDYDRQSRLIRSVARGSDSTSSGEHHYRWNASGQLLSSDSGYSQVVWHYDKSGRELGVSVSEYSPLNASTTEDHCQLWDHYGNCTLSYSREMEVSALGLFRHNTAAASRYEYWDQP